MLWNSFHRISFFSSFYSLSFRQKGIEVSSILMYKLFLFWLSTDLIIDQSEVQSFYIFLFNSRSFSRSFINSWHPSLGNRNCAGVIPRALTHYETTFDQLFHPTHDITFTLSLFFKASAREMTLLRGTFQ